MDIYQQRREQLMRRVDTGVIFLPGHSEVPRNDATSDSSHPFRQSSTFRYFTGVDRQEYSALLVPAEERYILFGPMISKKTQVWTGTQPSRKELQKQYGCDEFLTPDKLGKMLSTSRLIHMPFKTELPCDIPYTEVHHSELADAIFDMRLKKDPTEIERISQACAITRRGHLHMMGATRPGIAEHHVRAAADFVFSLHNVIHAYSPIVTVKGNILHNDHHGNILQSKQLLLADVGCEVGSYASDVTRTWPVSGRFSPQQKHIYDVVLQAQKECIGMVRPGATIADIHAHSKNVLADGLRDQGILKGSRDAVAEAVSLFYMHGIGHHLGLDVHDCHGIVNDSRHKERPLIAGEVVTVEPGIYFNEVLLWDKKTVRKYKGVVDFSKARELVHGVSGIRIEDDIHVTQTGHTVLSEGIPKERDDIEEIIGSMSSYPFVMSSTDCCR